MTIHHRLGKLLTVAAAAIAASAWGAQPQVHWQTLGNRTEPDGTRVYTQRFTVRTDRPFGRLAFNQFARRMRAVNPADTLIEIVPGYYCVASPRFAGVTDSVVVDIDTYGTLNFRSYGADGVHLTDADGSPVAVEFTRGDILADPSLWSLPGKDLMPYGDAVYDRNAALAGGRRPGVYDVVPSFKSVRLTGSTTGVPLKAIRYIDITDAPRPEWCRMTIADSVLTVEATKGFHDMAARRVLQAIGSRDRVPEAVIEDYPDFAYRGLMIDIARNYQTPAEMRRIIDIMARYGLNVLHFHFTDDEAWRLEIPGMPELTEVGGRRGYTTDETEYLAQIFTGDGNPDTPRTGKAWFTRDEFIDMLRYAADRGVTVLPEVESPGHARAAIKAMEKRVRSTGDDTYRLIDPADTSRYTSAQAFHDNAMNPAIPGPVLFMTHVASELAKMYAEAGLKMPALHIGGDEVANGAWTGSPLARSYMERHGITDERRLHLIFIRELVDRLSAMDIPVSGWQEIAVGHDDEFNTAVRPHTYSVNCWSTIGSKASVPIQSARAGYPTVLSNVDHFYLDMAYSNHPQELGLTWGGTVDEFDALSGYPARLCAVEPAYRPNIIGISGQVWAETMRSGADLEMMLLPKIMGMAERAWNADSTYSEADFNAVISTREMPVWAARGYNMHLRQPGVRIIDGHLHMNSPYPADSPLAPVIRYTLDGTEPTATSAIYTGPLDTGGKACNVRAALWAGPWRSLSTILYANQ